MPFEKGKSGNPGGKPKGQTPKGLFREQVNAALPGIVQGLIEAAQAGDVQAANIILSKVIPNLKPTTDPLTLPSPTGASLADRGMTVLGAATTGKLSADDASQVMSLLVSQAKLVEQSEVMERLEKIEEWLAKGQK
jgi:hypothetical protein